MDLGVFFFGMSQDFPPLGFIVPEVARRETW